MKQLVALALVLAASPAAAQPSRGTCQVNIARAPDDVRGVVESWVQAEPRCTISLEVRIVPTNGGLYLLARDEFGRVRERVVPDAQSAGVLIASWVAADSHENQTPFDVRHPSTAPAPAAVPPAAVLGSEGMLAPGEGLAPGATPAIAATATARPLQPRWLSLGGMFAMSGTGGGGLRGELDWKARRIMSIGFASSVSTSGMIVAGPTYDSMGQLDSFDGKLIAYLALTGQRGRWRLRASVGLGAVYTQAMLRRQQSSSEASGLFPTGELAVSVSRELGTNWALSAGPVFSLYAQEYEILDAGQYDYYYTVQRRDIEPMMFLAARYRL
ncbi:MAG TPA: hypothetical protein VIV11_32875 [Kofleriaceae bacterium]